MTFTNIHSIRSLTETGHHWLLKVRVLNIWRSISLEDGAIKGLNVMFIDDSNTRIVAFANHDDYPPIEAALFVGRLYLVSNFSVKKLGNEPFARPVRYPFKIFMSNYTRFEEVTDNLTRIPYVGFDLYNLKDVEKLSAQSLFLTDVVGLLQDVKPTYSFINQRGTPKSFVPFFISDGSYSAKVIFWDDIGTHFLEDIEKLREVPIIISIICCKATNRDGDIYFSSNPATKFYLNCDHHSVVRLKKKLANGCMSLATLTPQAAIIKSHNYTMAQLSNLGINMLNTEVVLHGKFIDLCRDSPWFEYVCTKCHHQIKEFVGKAVICASCGKKLRYPEKWFTICGTAADKTGSVSIMLLNREVRRLIGHDAFEVGCLPTSGNDSKFPLILNEILEREFELTINLTEDNFAKENRVYTCVNLVERSPPCVSVSSDDQSTMTDRTAGIETEELVAVEGIEQDDTPSTAFSSSKERDQKIKELKTNLYSYANDTNIQLVNLLTLSDKHLYDIAPQMLVKFYAEIVGLEDHQAWYVNTCVICGTNILERATYLFCPSCNKLCFHPLKRCSLRIYVHDLLRTVSLTLTHEVIRKLSPTPLEDLLENKALSRQMIPSAFLQLIGRKLLFVIEASFDKCNGKTCVTNCVDIENF